MNIDSRIYLFPEYAPQKIVDQKFKLQALFNMHFCLAGISSSGGSVIPGIS